MTREQFESICKNIPMLEHYLSFMTFRSGANEYQLTIFSQEHKCMETHLNGAWRFYQGISEQKMLIAPLEPTPKMIDSTWYDDIEELSHNSRNEFIYKKMLGVLLKEK